VNNGPMLVHPDSAAVRMSAAKAKTDFIFIRCA
jgi:hypothetical protein